MLTKTPKIPVKSRIPDRLIDRQQIPNGISEENLLRFLSYYNDVNPIWLLTGEGEILLTKTPKIPVKSRIPER